MAIDSHSRWQIIREIICEQKSGTLIVQLGRNFLRWMLNRADVVCISSTLPEFSFTQFLLQDRSIPRENLLAAQSRISGCRSLGASLLQLETIDRDLLAGLLKQHWLSLTFHLLQSTSHLFWSGNETLFKDEFIRLDIPLSALLLSCERNSLETRTAIRIAQILPSSYHVSNWPQVETALEVRERRIIPYLKAGSSVKEILHDPELDCLCVYRVFFLLWLTGQLQENQRALTSAPPHESHPAWERIKSIPPDWIFPLIAGTILGALLTSRPGLPATPSHVSPVLSHQFTEKDFSREDTEKDFATEDTE